MKNKLLLSAGCALLMLCGSASALDLKNPALTPVKFEAAPAHEPLKLIENGKLNFAIVRDKKAQRAGQAAALLSEAVEKCTGVKPAVLEPNEADKLKEYRYKIYLGFNETAKKLGAVASGPQQGYQLFTCPEGVVITGYESTNESGVTKGELTVGTLWGAYDFAERVLGCRWYFPGEYGSLYPKITDLTMPAVRYTDQPRFYNRDSCWIVWSLDNGRKKWESLLGKGKLRGIETHWRMSGFIGAPKGFNPNHDPDPIRIAKFYPDRLKDIFFTNEKGHMYYNPKAHGGNDFDLTNLKFADILIDALKKYYASGKKDYNIWSFPPNSQYVNFGQCDGEIPGMDMMRNPTVKELKLNFQDVYGRFLQYFATRVKEEFPGLRVAFMPYQAGGLASKDPRWKLPDNIDLRVCTHAFPRVPRNKKKIAGTIQCLKDWYAAMGNTPIASLWFYHIPENTGSPFLRAIAAQFVGESVNVCGDLLGRTNIFFDQYGGLNWSFYYSEYCGAHALWNPDFNADAAIDEHWEPFYGKEAGAELKKFHRLLKDSYINLYMMNDAENGINPLYPAEVIDKLETYLKNAASHIKPGTVEAKRFALFSDPWKDAITAQRTRQNYTRPEYPVCRLQGQDKVELNGKGDESFWKNVKPIGLLEPKGTGAEAKHPVSVKMVWDDKGIYGLLEAPFKPLASEKRDVWGNDSCEIFIVPVHGKQQEAYYHFTVDAFGNQHTGRSQIYPVKAPYGRYKMPGFRKAVFCDDKSWNMEFFIPFEDMKTEAPKAGDSWGVNIVTNKLGDPKEYMSSSMTLGNNHNVGMYGTIKFLGKGN